MSGNTPPRPRVPPNTLASPTDDPEPRNINGGGRFFTAEHNAWLDRRNGWPAGTALDLYQADAQLNAEARRVILAQPPGAPPNFDEVDGNPPTPPPNYTRLATRGGGGVTGNRDGSVRLLLGPRNAATGGVARGAPIGVAGNRGGSVRLSLGPRNASTGGVARGAPNGVPDLFNITDPNNPDVNFFDVIDSMGGWEAFEPQFRASFEAREDLRFQPGVPAGGRYAVGVPFGARQARRDELDVQLEGLHQAWLARGTGTATASQTGTAVPSGDRTARPANTRPPFGQMTEAERRADRRGLFRSNDATGPRPSPIASRRGSNVAAQPLDNAIDGGDDDGQMGRMSAEDDNARPRIGGVGTSPLRPRSSETRRSADAQAAQERSRARARARARSQSPGNNDRTSPPLRTSPRRAQAIATPAEDVDDQLPAQDPNFEARRQDLQRELSRIRREIERAQARENLKRRHFPPRSPPRRH